MNKHPVILGRYEYADIVGVFSSVPVKIDTGAYRSSIHVKSVEVYVKNGEKVLRFQLLGHPAYPESQVIETKEFNTTKVRSSGGHEAARYEVMLKIKLGYKVFTTSFTLSERSKNAFPVLIGRRALRRRFLVDSDRSSVSRKELQVIVDKSMITQTDKEEVLS